MKKITNNIFIVSIVGANEACPNQKGRKAMPGTEMRLKLIILIVAGLFTTLALVVPVVACLFTSLSFSK